MEFKFRNYNDKLGSDIACVFFHFLQIDEDTPAAESVPSVSTSPESIAIVANTTFTFNESNRPVVAESNPPAVVESNRPAVAVPNRSNVEEFSRPPVSALKTVKKDLMKGNKFFVRLISEIKKNEFFFIEVGV